ncbi:MAG: hypothetical protein FWG23_08190 [Eggerthellaceae bacterium]|nr:hypothetical protein [Eggerthellaceae bacterium]
MRNKADYLTGGGQKMQATVTKRAAEKPARAKRLLGRARVLALLAAASIGLVTMAYLAALTNVETNVFGIGTTDVTIDEDFRGWEAKQVQLTMGAGEDYVPSVVRAMVVPYLMDAEGNYIACDLAEFSAPVGNKMDLGDVILEFAADWSAEWIYDDDGYFYYASVLYPTTAGNANQTSVLLTKVSLSDQAREKYGDEVQINIEVLADILQAEGKAGQEWGITVDMATGTVTKP